MGILIKKDTETDRKRDIIIKYLAAAVLIMVLLVILEIFVFNFRHWQSVNNVPVTAEYTYSDNLAAEDVNAFRVMPGETEPYLEIDGLDLDVENIAMDFILPEQGVTAVETITYHLEVVDQGNRNRYPLPQMEFMHLVPQSHFDYLDLYGRAKALRLCFDDLNEGQLIRVEYLILNSVVPLMISKKRILALFTFVYLLFLLRPGSFLYSYRAGKRSRVRTVSIVFLLIFEVAFSWWAVNLNKAFQTTEKDGQRQFMLLAESLASGHTYLPIDPPDALVNMEDPYDTQERLNVCSGDREALWDTAYYNGHYYVYFGVGPVLLFYLPYYLITGQHINTIIVMFVNMVLIFIAAALLIKEIMERWFEEVPLPVYLMLTSMVSWGSGLWYLVMSPDFYGVPLAFALALCLFGIYFWLHAITDEGIKIVYIASGSLCMAFEAAVRPQFLLASFLALLIFWGSTFKDRKLFSGKSVGATLGFIIPYIVVAAGVMYYNFVRFGSVFDFGANYNLTNNNMPYRGVHLDRLLNATVGFLFSQCMVTNRFPYFMLSPFITTYQGPTGDEFLLGGLIYNYPFLIITLIPFVFRKYFKEKTLYIYTLTAPVAALIVMITDANMAGVIMRYNVDFAWYLMLSFVFIFCSLWCHRNYIGISAQNTDIQILVRRAVQKVLYMILLLFFAIFMLRSFLYMFTGMARPEVNAKLVWHIVKHLVEFWH